MVEEKSLTILLIGESNLANEIVAKIFKARHETNKTKVNISLYQELDGEKLLYAIEKLQKVLDGSYLYILLTDHTVSGLQEANQQNKRLNIDFNLIKDLKL